MIRRDLGIALAGIGGGQLILLAATPILARAFGPAAFGTYAVVVAVAGIVATVSALRLDLAVVSATDAEVAPLVRAGFLLPLFVVPPIVGLLALGLMLPWGRELPYDRSSLVLIGAIALFQGLAMVGAALGTRLGAFPTVAAMKVVQPLAFALTALLVIHELSLAMALGWVAALLVSLGLLRRIPMVRGWRESLDVVKRMWRFPAISTPMALLDALALALPLLVIAATFGDEAAGNYSQVQRLIGAPMTLLAMAGGQVFARYAGENLRASEAVTPLIRRFVFFMVGLAVVVLLGVVIVGDPLLRLLVGPGWRTDTWFLVLALLPLIFRVIASPVSSILVLTHRIAALAKWQVTYFVTTAITLLMSARWLEFEGMLLALAVNELVLYGAYLALSVDASRQPPAPAKTAQTTTS